MALRELHIHHLRNLDGQRLQFSDRVNLIHGANGSGKTSLLEAIYYLSAGRSFRTSKHRNVVSRDSNLLTLFGRVENEWGEQRLGISRDLAKGETVLRKNGLRVHSLSEMARELPVCVIEPGTFDLVAGGPGQRRQFLDWLVFHVEHDYGGLWQQCQKTIRQRNQLLRRGIMSDGQLGSWNARLVALADQVTTRRMHWFERFRAELQALFEQSNADWAKDLELIFFRGWDSKRTLGEILETNQETEHRAGHTLYGPNRCDIRIRIKQRPAGEMLSRGQQRTLVILMKLAQMAVVNGRRQDYAICLVDDINAELDQANQKVLAERLLGLGCQLFVTSIEPPDEGLWTESTIQDHRMFHVEHGEFSEQ